MAAQYGALVFMYPNGQSDVKDIYFDDTANNDVNFDTGIGAGSTTDRFWIPKVNGIITDVVLAAASGQTKTMVCIDGNPTGSILRNALHLVSITFRPQLRIPVRAGQKISLKQLA